MRAIGDEYAEPAQKALTDAIELVLREVADALEDDERDREEAA